MEERAQLELVLVAATMAALFLLGAAAVVIFWRVWRRERKGKNPPPHDGDAEK